MGIRERFGPQKTVPTTLEKTVRVVRVLIMAVETAPTPPRLNPQLNGFFLEKTYSYLMKRDRYILLGNGFSKLFW